MTEGFCEIEDLHHENPRDGHELDDAICIVIDGSADAACQGLEAPALKNGEDDWINAVDSDLSEKIHWIKQVLHRLEYMAMDRREMRPLRMLYEKSFPVSYCNSFYDSLAEGQFGNSAIFTRIARLPVDEHVLFHLNEIITRRRISNASMTYPVNEAAAKLNHNSVPEIYSINEDRFVLLGGITVGINQLDPLDDTHPTIFRESNRPAYSQGCYIMTLATDEIAQRAGIASALLQYAVEESEKIDTIGVVYLHVVTYNKGAIKFYESHGFTCFKCIPRFYLINGEHYSAFLFAKYLRDAKPGTLKTTLWQRALTVLRKWLYSLLQ